MDNGEQLEHVSLNHIDMLARVGHAFSDSTRAQVLLCLARKECLPSELAQRIGVSRQVMSNQLSCLRGCGLVTPRKEGRQVWYSLAHPSLGKAVDDLLVLTRELSPSCCSERQCQCNK